MDLHLADALEVSQAEESLEGWPLPVEFLPAHDEALIPLTRGYWMLVDREDHATLSRHRWCAVLKRGVVYPRRRILRGEMTPDGEPLNVDKICAHQQIAGYILGGTFHVDHWNRYSLDNRKANLRIVLPGVNTLNGMNDKRSVLDLLGIQKDLRSLNSPFRARVGFRGEYYSCGYHKTAQKAAAARDDKLYELIEAGGLLKRIPRRSMLWELFNYPSRFDIPKPAASPPAVRLASAAGESDFSHANGDVPAEADDIPFAAD